MDFPSAFPMDFLSRPFLGGQMFVCVPIGSLENVGAAPRIVLGLPCSKPLPWKLTLSVGLSEFCGTADTRAVSFHDVKGHPQTKCSHVAGSVRGTDAGLSTSRGTVQLPAPVRRVGPGHRRCFC